MSKELIKKYKAEFNAWVEGESLLYKTTTKDVWVQANNIDVFGLFSNPSHYIKAIVIDDSYVIYRKALAEGKTIQHISYTTGEWVDFNKGFEPTASYAFLSPPEYYRIKPEKPQFKVGDWVVHQNGDIFQYEGKTCIDQYIKLWQPTEGEWCWVGYKLMKFSKLIKEDYRTIFEFISTDKDANGHKIKEYILDRHLQIVEPFIGQLPTVLKDNT